VDITSEYVAALRSSLTGEGDYAALSAKLQARDGVERSTRIFAALSGMALHVAARRRFARGYTDAEVIRLVGQARAMLEGEGFEIDPLVAEATLRGTLGDTASSRLAGAEAATALFPLLIVLLEQEGITAGQMDDFLADVLPLAEAWLARQGSTEKEP
jgi:hypothetical protein